jgi:hypothetical protein
MLGTIMIGRHSTVQGDVVQQLPDGRMIVRVGNLAFAGRPVLAAEAAEAERMARPAELSV